MPTSAVDRVVRTRACLRVFNASPSRMQACSVSEARAATLLIPDGVRLSYVGRVMVFE
jgi:hypothetical protein